MRNVAILGAGLVTKPLADYLLDQCRYRVVIAERIVAKAERLIAGRPNGSTFAVKTDQLEELDDLVREMDLIVSMIPPTKQVGVAKLCLRHRKPLINTSFISPEMQQLDAEAKEKGVLLLNEMGEDPGLDHMGGKQLIDQVEREGGRVFSLATYGAGLPAFEHNRNPFGYKFSWSPKGVMRAARTPAAYVEEGEVIEVPGEELFDHHWLVDIEGLGTFETYPNRSSLRYLPYFGLTENDSLYRGLLRYTGYCNTLKALIKLGLLDGTTGKDFSGLTYREFTCSLVGKPDGEADDVAAFLGETRSADNMNRLKWLGLFDETPVAVARGATVDVLVDLMVKRLSYEPHERDMILVHAEIVAEINGGRERRLSTMRAEGVPHGDSAMSRAVSLPAAIGCRLVLEGKLSLAGVHIPTLPELYEPVLCEMAAEYGFKFQQRTIDAPVLKEESSR